MNWVDRSSEKQMSRTEWRTTTNFMQPSSRAASNEKMIKLESKSSQLKQITPFAGIVGNYSAKDETTSNPAMRIEVETEASTRNPFEGLPSKTNDPFYRPTNMKNTSEEYSTRINPSSTSRTPFLDNTIFSADNPTELKPSVPAHSATFYGKPSLGGSPRQHLVTKAARTSVLLASSVSQSNPTVYVKLSDLAKTSSTSPQAIKEGKRASLMNRKPGEYSHRMSRCRYGVERDEDWGQIRAYGNHNNLLSNAVKRTSQIWLSSAENFSSVPKETLMKYKEEEQKLKQELKGKLLKQKAAYKIHEKPARFLSKEYVSNSHFHPKDFTKTDAELFKIVRKGLPSVSKNPSFLDTFYHKNGIKTDRAKIFESEAYKAKLRPPPPPPPKPMFRQKTVGKIRKLLFRRIPSQRLPFYFQTFPDEISNVESV